MSTALGYGRLARHRKGGRGTVRPRRVTTWRSVIRRTKKGARETADLIRAAGKEPLVYRADVSDEKSVREMMERVFLWKF